MKLGAQAGIVPLGRETWGDTAIDAGSLSGALENILTGETFQVQEGRILVADAFASFPGALLIDHKPFHEEPT